MKRREQAHELLMHVCAAVPVATGHMKLGKVDCIKHYGSRGR
jgi:hypothetical protein